MFRWASPQPISTTQTALLEQAGGFRRPWGEAWEQPDGLDLVLFQPPHALLASGDMAAGVLGSAYDQLTAVSERLRLVNGERLMALGAAEIAHWLMGHPPARPLELPAVEPLLAATTLTLLQAIPGLEPAYQRLDGSSQRGGAAADLAYARRLQPSAEALLEAWSGLPFPPAPDSAADPAVQRLEALAEELERSVLACEAARERATRLQRLSEGRQAELRRSAQLLRRLIHLQARLF
ncbi:MAG: hypothetical protein AAFX65_02050 [Cyanobacteria bacterium J06638_7]